MDSLAHDLTELRVQLESGSVPRAYAAILGYMSRIRSEFAADPEDRVVSGLYQGAFDMTYFAVVPPSLKVRNLKLAVVFDYTTFRFQVWLAARNREEQRKYHSLLLENGWSAYPLVKPAPGVDAITVSDVAPALALVDEQALMDSIRASVDRMACELEQFLSTHAA